MPIAHSVWTVSVPPHRVEPGVLPSEQMLEEMIIAQPSILSAEWLLVGGQIETGFGGRIDLLAIAPDGRLVLVELKRDRTPREVVAQALDYASWVEGLEAADIATVYDRFRPGRSLATDFLERFGQPLDEEAINGSHQIVIVGAALDAASERIVGYLNRRGIAINVLFFQIFNYGGQQLLSRAWLIDPNEVLATSSVSLKKVSVAEPWNGEFYVTFGDSPSRSWEEARRYGFVCAGGGPWYSNTLKLLHEGARIWAAIPKVGFVGAGRVTGPRVAARDFLIDGRPALDVLQAGYHREFADDDERCEYFVPVEWTETRPATGAIWDVEMFANQNSVCRPTTPKWRSTTTKLRSTFQSVD